MLKLFILGGVLAVIGLLGLIRTAHGANIAGFAIAGIDANDGEFPWQVSIQRWRSSGSSPEILCGGTLIKRNRVLTAAHCLMILKNLNVTMFRVVAGALNIYKPDGTEQVVGVSKIVIHPNATGDPQYRNDIALLTLSPDFNMTQRVQAIKIAPANITPSGNCTVTGWGNTRSDGDDMSPIYPEKLQVITLEYLDHKVCADRFAGINSILPGMICASGYFKAPCGGDSGGALVCKNEKDEKYLAGVVSWGLEPCAQNPFYPSVFVNVPYFWDWIQAIRSKKS